MVRLAFLDEVTKMACRSGTRRQALWGDEGCTTVGCCISALTSAPTVGHARIWQSLTVAIRLFGEVPVVALGFKQAEAITRPIDASGAPLAVPREDSDVSELDEVSCLQIVDVSYAGRSAAGRWAA